MFESLPSNVRVNGTGKFLLDHIKDKKIKLRGPVLRSQWTTMVCWLERISMINDVITGLKPFGNT